LVWLDRPNVHSTAPQTSTKIITFGEVTITIFTDIGFTLPSIERTFFSTIDEYDNYNTDETVSTNKHNKIPILTAIRGTTNYCGERIIQWCRVIMEASRLTTLPWWQNWLKNCWCPGDTSVEKTCECKWPVWYQDQLHCCIL
jgi:hypothetical protein